MTVVPFREPSLLCAAIQIVRPLESTAETQPQLKPGFAEIDSDDFPVLHDPLVSTVIGFTRQIKPSISSSLRTWLVGGLLLGPVFFCWLG